MPDKAEDLLSELPILLYPSRVKLACFLVFCLALTGVGIWMVVSGERTGYFVGGVFAIGSVIFAFSLPRKASYLLLDQNGFTFASLYRVHSVRWKDVEEFGVLPTAGRQMVCWNFVPGFVVKQKRMRALNQAIGGFDAGLPDNYGLDPESLATLMAVLAGTYGAPAGDAVDQLTFDKAEPRGESVP